MPCAKLGERGERCGALYLEWGFNVGGFHSSRSELEVISRFICVVAK